jgi:hypothetical protein
MSLLKLSEDPGSKAHSWWAAVVELFTQCDIYVAIQSDSALEYSRTRVVSLFRIVRFGYDEIAPIYLRRSLMEYWDATWT